MGVIPFCVGIPSLKTTSKWPKDPVPSLIRWKVPKEADENDDVEALTELALIEWSRKMVCVAICLEKHCLLVVCVPVYS